MHFRICSAVVLAAFSLSGCSSQQTIGDVWLRDGRESSAEMAQENAHPYDWREIHSVRLVRPERVNAAVSALGDRSVLLLSRVEASNFALDTPALDEGESFYLLRGVDVVSNAITIKVYQSGRMINIFSGTSSTCFFFSPRVRAQPLIVALSEEPSRVILGVSCDG
jgi:hypothetical protein